jgi:trigger factor
LEELKSQLKQEIEREKQSAFDHRLRDQVVDQLLQNHSFEIPESLIKEQTHVLVSDTKMRLAAQGMDLNKLGMTEEKLHENYQEMAKKQVQTFLILEKIAEQEGITVIEEEVEGRLKEISERTHQKLDVVKRYYEKNGLLPEVKAGILNDKTLNFLIQKSTLLTEGKDGLERAAEKPQD